MESQPQTSSRRKGKKQPAALYEFDLDDNTELISKVTCFFEDTHRVQIFLKSIWQQHKNEISRVG
jgi:hypothetical protein